MIIYLEFIFHILWQTFLNFCLFQGRSQVAGGPEASKNSKKSAKRNEKKIREILSKTCYFSNKILLEAGNSCLQEVGNNLQGNMMGTKGSSIVEVVVVVDSIVVEVVDNMDMETVRMLRIVVVVVVADYCSQMLGLGLDYSLMKNVQLEQLLKLLVYLYLSLVEQL